MRRRWKLVGGAGLVGAGISAWIVLGHIPLSRGDTTTTTTSSAPSSTGIAAPVGTGVAASPEPTTDTPSITAPGWESQPSDRFAPPDIGPGTHWTYEDLGAADKARVDKGRDVTGWDKINNAYASASGQVAQRATTAAAANQIGITDNLANLGVVP